MGKHLASALFVLATRVQLSLCQDENTTAAVSNTAAGNSQLGWVSPGRRRSTWEIIWNCLTIFIICSWKCTHLNLPTVEESRGEWHKWRHIPYFPKTPLRRKWWRKLGFMLLIAVAPEVVIGLAVQQHVLARRDVREVQKRKYTMTHAFFARMGGFVVRVLESAQTHPVTNAKIPRPGEADPETADTELQQRHVRKEYRLTLSGLAELEAMDIAYDVKEEEIQDHAKADGFAKLFAVVQAGGLVIQSVARKASGLQISELELMTMAFSFCALLTYVLWWYKPFGTERAIVFVCPESHETELCNKLDDQPGGEHSIFVYSTDDSTRVYDVERDSLHNLFFYTMDFRGADMPFFTMYISAAIFGAIHLAAWNWIFPQPLIQTLWRWFCVAALGSSLVPPLCICSVAVIRIITGASLTDFPEIIYLIIGIFILALPLLANIISRLALIVLTFYCFTSMPASVYDDLDWARFIPHFS